MRVQRRNGVLAALIIVAAVVATSCGGSGSTHSSEPSSDVVTIKMTDNAYSPVPVTVPSGKKVTFDFVNEGSVTHEAIIGDSQAQRDHAAGMKGDGSMDGMAGMGDGDGARSVAVKPGKTGHITTTFAKAGKLIIGCHEPGHYESGMKATLNVS